MFLRQTITLNTIFSLSSYKQIKKKTGKAEHSYWLERLYEK